jgi:hypothetical protein
LRSVPFACSAPGIIVPPAVVAMSRGPVRPRRASLAIRSRAIEALSSPSRRVVGLSLRHAVSRTERGIYREVPQRLWRITLASDHRLKYRVFPCHFSDEPDRMSTIGSTGKDNQNYRCRLRRCGVGWPSKIGLPRNIAPSHGAPEGRRRAKANKPSIMFATPPHRAGVSARSSLRVLHWQLPFRRTKLARQSGRMLNRARDCPTDRPSGQGLPK